MSKKEDKTSTKTSKKSTSRKLLKPALIILIALIFLCVSITAILFIFTDFKISDLWLVEPSANVYSQDQAKVIEQLGKPESFNITFNRSDDRVERIEVWRYVDMDEIFTFKNGKFIGRSHNFFDQVDDIPIHHLTLEPKDYYDVKSLEDLNEILGTSPSATTSLDESILNGETYYYEYGIWLHAAEVNKTIVSIDQKAFSQKDGENEITSSDIDNLTTNASNNDGTFINRKYDFSFDAGNSINRLTEKQEDVSWALDNYNYCYKTEDAVKNSICGEDAIPIFSITIMNRTQYNENVMDSEHSDFITLDMTHEGVDEQQFNINEKFYLLSFPNGDVGNADIPEELTSEGISKTFSVAKDE